jgi:hypothetical protein
MRTSALSVIRPREIDAIQQAAILRFVDGLRPPAESDPDYEAIERSYAKENDELRSMVETLRRRNRELVQELDEARDRLSNAELLSQFVPASAPVIDPVGAARPGRGRGPAVRRNPLLQVRRS